MPPSPSSAARARPTFARVVYVLAILAAVLWLGIYAQGPPGALVFVGLLIAAFIRVFPPPPRRTPGDGPIWSWFTTRRIMAAVVALGLFLAIVRGVVFALAASANPGRIVEVDPPPDMFLAIAIVLLGPIVILAYSGWNLIAYARVAPSPGFHRGQ